MCWVRVPSNVDMEAAEVFSVKEDMFGAGFQMSAACP